MLQHSLTVILAVVLVVASVFTLGFLSFILSGIIMATGILIALVALWGLIEDTSNVPFQMNMSSKM
jgi:protein-S-isoprenylcysteine O-methyltransferase Ste14